MTGGTLIKGLPSSWLTKVDPCGAYAAVVGSWTRTLDASAISNGVMLSAAQNDSIGWDLDLAPGTWTWGLMYQGHTNRGIAHLVIDGVDYGTIDLYNAGGNVRNLYAEVTGIVMPAYPAAWVRRAVLLASTKNASSTGYILSLQGIWLRRTA